LGETLRDARTSQNRTLRDVSTAANVSLGYLSEVERGRKEASSELLASICVALDLELSELLDTVSEAIRVDTVLAKAAVTANSVKAQNRPHRHPFGPDKAHGDKAVTGGRHLPRTAAAESLRIVLPYGRTEAPVT
jgi:transcriptional regulator with XRE-family HTH domain